MDSDCHCRSCEGFGPKEHLAECCCDNCHDSHDFRMDSTFCDRCQELALEEAEYYGNGEQQEA